MTCHISSHMKYLEHFGFGQLELQKNYGYVYGTWVLGNSKGHFQRFFNITDKSHDGDNKRQMNVTHEDNRLLQPYSQS